MNTETEKSEGKQTTESVSSNAPSIWTKPEYEEISLACEINAYACAEM
ncbi:MAG TPA: pyrroloquinoline quinone precursor peptide PqqA [Terriglobales bacterium]|nr:pyrroloquinoline quinone precursor peptide PqqA [Terriglobales bacterium]